MKKIKIIALLLMVTAAMYAQNDYRELSWRVHLGMNISNVTNIADFEYSDDWTTKPGMGVNFGFRVDYQFNRFIAIQTGLDYSLKGWKATEEGVEDKYDYREYYEYGDYYGEYYYVGEAEYKYRDRIKMSYLSIPILAGFRYDFKNNRDIRLVVNTGPYLAIGIAGKQHISYSDNLDEEFAYEYPVFGKEKDVEDKGSYGFKRFDMGWRIDAGIDIKKFYVGAAIDMGFINMDNGYYDKSFDKPLKNRNYSINIGYNF